MEMEEWELSACRQYKKVFNKLKAGELKFDQVKVCKIKEIERKIELKEEVKENIKKEVASLKDLLDQTEK